MSEVSETDELEDIPPQNLEECFKTLSTEARRKYFFLKVSFLNIILSIYVIIWSNNDIDTVS